MVKKYRKEKDFLGEKLVEQDVLYGIHTKRAIENFPISDQKNHIELIKAICEIKISAAKLFSDYGVFSEEICKAIMQAGREIIEGKLLDNIVVDVFQAGAGTSLHMNINEVIANRANEILGEKRGVYKPVHPNDTVNFGQSTNDVIPTAMRIAVIRVTEKLLKELKSFAKIFKTIGESFKEIIKAGRTHLSDAVPISLGEEILAYGLAIEKDIKKIENVLKSLHFVGLSGTAVGSGVNAPDFYRENIIIYLSKETGINLKKSQSLYEAMQNQAEFSHLMSAIKVLCLNLIRICNDLRLMGSGPNTGLNEIKLPEVQAGSSIMPGKINPSILEMLTMVCFYVIGMENTVAMAVQGGQFELNVFMPLIAYGTLNSIEYLTSAIKITREKCIKGIKPNKTILEKYAMKTLGLATVLSPEIGYENTAQIVKIAKKNWKKHIRYFKRKRFYERV